MALVLCPECQKEMSDTVKKCPHCGYINKKSKNKKSINREFLKKHRKKIILIFILLILVIVGITAFIVYSHINSNKLNSEEENALVAVNVLKSSLKNQDSLSVYAIWYRSAKSEQFLIDYSAQNGFGGMNRNIALIENGKFMGTDSKANNSITKYTSKEDMIEILASKGIESIWNSKGSESAPFIELNKDKILKNLDK